MMSSVCPPLDTSIGSSLTYPMLLGFVLPFLFVVVVVVVVIVLDCVGRKFLNLLVTICT
jgi:hypothetical protein